MKKELYPIKFHPIFKEKIWGGRNLEKLLGKNLPPGKKIGESWEICDRGADQTIVQNGLYKGQTLHELMLDLKQSLLGNAFLHIPPRFPLLFKIIDAQDDLSLQVHPDDTYAARHEKADPGKTEMWYVIHSENNAKIFCGLKKKTDPEKFKQALQSQTILEYIQAYLSKPGDVFFLPAGTVHTLGAGNVVIEIQENSDLTYRLSDWGRTGINGQPRPLHIEKALEVIEFQPREESLYQKARPDQILIRCPYFTATEKIHAQTFTEEIHPRSFQVWTVLEGRGTLNKEPFQKGDFLLIPAHIGQVTAKPESQTHILKTLPCQR